MPESFSGNKYAKTLDMAGFRIWRVTQSSKYATIWLNMSEQDMIIPEFTIIERVLNMSLTIQSERLLYKSISTH